MTELMDWTWTNLLLDWTNAKWVLKGDLDIFARTASKYDDCRLLHLPNLRFWLVVVSVSNTFIIVTMPFVHIVKSYRSA